MNYFAIIVSSIVTYLLSYVWYIMLFSKPYVEGLNKTTEEMAKGPSMLVASIFQIIGHLVMFYILLLVLHQFKVESITGALWIAFLMWLGFVAAVLGPMYAFEAYPLSFFGITAGSVLLSLLVGAVILQVWK